MVGPQLGPFGLPNWATVAYVRSFLSDRALDEHGFGWQHERMRNRLPRLWTIRVHRLVDRDRPWNRAGLLPSIAHTPLMPITALGAFGARYRPGYVDCGLPQAQVSAPPPVETGERRSG